MHQVQIEKSKVIPLIFTLDGLQNLIKLQQFANSFACCMELKETQRIVCVVEKKLCISNL